MGAVQPGHRQRPKDSTFHRLDFTDHDNHEHARSSTEISATGTEIWRQGSLEQSTESDGHGDVVAVLSAF